MPPQHWQKDWQHYRYHTGEHQSTCSSSSGGHVPTRHGLDISHLAFGSVLRDYIRTPTTSPAMGNILNHFLQYDSGILTHVHNVLFSSVSRFDILLIFFLCSIEPKVNIMVLQGREILLSSTSSIVSDCHCPVPTAQLRCMQRGTLNSFIGYVARNIHMQWIWLKCKVGG